MGTVTLTSYRGYQDIGTVGQNVQQLAGNIQSINQILDVGLMNTRDYMHGFVRVEHLIGLGLATLINTDQLTSAGAGGGSTTIEVQDSITGAGTVASPLQLSGDIGSPGNDYFYGTNGSGVKGFYALSSYSGTVTSVGLSDTSTTAIYAITGSPITSSGTIDLTLKTQSANKVLAGPTTGSAAQPAFRALVANDIPSLPYGSGTVTSVGVSNADGYIVPSGTNPVTSSGTIALNLSSGAVTDLGLAATSIQPGGIQNMESAGWNSSSGAIQLSLVVAQDILIPYTATLREVDVLTQGAGSCTVTLTKCAIGGFPGSLADITNGHAQTFTSNATQVVAATLASQGWTTAFSQNDVVRITLTANIGFTSVKVILRMY